MGRRAPDTGSVTKRADGRFWARGPRSAGRPSLRVWDTFEEANAARVAYLQELERADPRTLPGATLRRVGEKHMAELEADDVPALASQRSRWKHLLAAPFVDDRIEDLRQPAIETWARSIRQPRGPLAPAYVDAIVGLLSGICARCVRAGTLAGNPCIGLRLPPVRRTHDPWTYLVPEEQERLLAAPIPEADHYLIQAALGTAVREGELFALRLPDVHLADHRIIVRYGSSDGATKGGLVQQVPLFGVGLDAFRAWLPLLGRWCPENPRRLVFPGPKGGMRSVGHPLDRKVRRGERMLRIDGWKAALAAAGIVAEDRHDGMPVRWHDLRHTCATSLVNGWWGPAWRLEDVQALLRHASISMTERYAHLAPGTVAALAARTGGVRVGYGLSAAAIEDQAGTKRGIALAPPPDPLMRYVGGLGPDGRAGEAAQGARTPPVPHEAARLGILALRRGDGGAALEMARALVEGTPALRDAVEACSGVGAWEMAALRLFEAALRRAEEQPAKRGRP